MSKFFFKTLKDLPKDADSINAGFLVRGGYIQKEMAGVYAFLPLGLKVMKKIEQIVREEMDAVGGQEILMNVLQPKEIWQETGRWEKVTDVMYRVGEDIGLAPTHEEQITDIIRKKISSYKNLPVSLYQIQTKFRKEARPKSGLLRGREFQMKDMYSFHATEEDFKKYYDQVAEAYKKIFLRIGLDAKSVVASGGMFSEYSDEFQVISPTGEDTIFYCDKCDYAENKEISKLKNNDNCPKCDGKIIEQKAIEVGNIFPLGTKYSKAMNAKFLDKDGKENDLIMGCYGFGLSRALATVVETKYDIEKNSLIWPKSIAPFLIEIISLKQNAVAEKIYQSLRTQRGNLDDVLFDDRELSAGEKFAEADLIGAPIRIIISEKSIASGGVEFVDLIEQTQEIVANEEILEKI